MSYYRTLIQQATTFVNLLVAAYKFENNGNDSHTNGFNGTVGSAVIFSTSNAVDGSAGQFGNDTNSRITIADNDAFSFTDGTNDKPFSIKANIYITQTAIINTIFSRYTGSNNNTSEYILYIRSTNKLALLLFNKAAGGVYIGAEVTTALSNNTPYNVVCTYNGSGSWTGIKIYVNGVSQTLAALNNGSGYTSMGNTSLLTQIANTSTTNNPFRGTIDELYVFNAELTPAQITTLQTNYYPSF
jgi:hypothetical protein